MLNYLKQYPGMFDSDEVKLLAGAFDKAWATVKASGSYVEGNAAKTRDLLARYIIEEAQTGQRDKRLLCDQALLHLAKKAKFRASRAKSSYFTPVFTERAAGRSVHLRGLYSGEPTMTANAQKRPRVLIVEDEPLVLMELEYTLTDLGYSVVKAQDLVTALILAQKSEVDVAILDVSLGGVTSEKIADLLQKKGVPFVLVSGYTDEGIPERHRNRLRVAKPFETPVLRR